LRVLRFIFFFKRGISNVGVISIFLGFVGVLSFFLLVIMVYLVYLGPAVFSDFVLDFCKFYLNGGTGPATSVPARDLRECVENHASGVSGEGSLTTQKSVSFEKKVGIALGLLVMAVILGNDLVNPRGAIRATLATFYQDAFDLFEEIRRYFGD
jgi:hypothetical protein